MKIEMGESLFYSWLRHVKECQIVQTNWKTSPEWTLLHEDELKEIMSVTDTYFSEKYGYNIYKQIRSLSQLLQQAECDVIGICMQNQKPEIHAVDVAFHGSGLQYGDRRTTIMKIIEKSIRTAMCIYGYLDAKEAEIIFASPKIGKQLQKDLSPCLEDAQIVLENLGFHFSFRLIGNENFYRSILNPLLLRSDGIADTNELFMRSYQMLELFDSYQNTKTQESNIPLSPNTEISKAGNNSGIDYSEFKVGRLVNDVMRRCLESGNISSDEVLNLQDLEYCKKHLHQSSFPVLVKKENKYDPARYYADPVLIDDTAYMLCNHWYDKNKYNITQWIEHHTDSESDLKIGKFVQTELRSRLENGTFTEDDLKHLQDKDYCKKEFGLYFPMLVKADADYNIKRYYQTPVTIKEKEYVICSQWRKEQKTGLINWMKKYQ